MAEFTPFQQQIAEFIRDNVRLSIDHKDNFDTHRITVNLMMNLDTTGRAVEEISSEYFEIVK